MKALVGFSGAGGVDLGLNAAGIHDVVGIEIADDIAAVARSNGLNTITADVLNFDFDTLGDFDLRHDSPPCPNFSQAKAGGEETELDVALGKAIADYIRHKRPRFYTLENVWGYRKSAAWAAIKDALIDSGYLFDYWHLCAADYGVPQTRRRMIVVARRDGIRPQKPRPTHQDYSKLDADQGFLFRPLPSWVGWYEAIEDLIPELEDSQFAAWQLKRLPEGFAPFLMSKHKGNGTNRPRFEIEPAETVTANHGGRAKAFVLGNGSRSELNYQHSPFGTVTASRNQNGIRAFVMNAANPNGNEKRKYRDESEPSKTVCASDSQSIRAFITDRLNSSSTSPNRMQDQPAMTVVCYSPKHQAPNGFMNGRVVKLSPRCLARFQAFPDWYELPESATLACRGIGNAVPPLMYQRVVESIL